MFVQYYAVKSISWLAMVCNWLVLLGFGGGMIVPAIYAMAEQYGQMGTTNI